MANFFKNIFGTAEPDEGFVDYADESYDMSSNAVTDTEAGYSGYSDRSYGSSKFINLGSSPVSKIKILKPKSYEEVIEVAVDLIRDGTIIFLNLNGLANDASMRIIDFMTGVTAAFEGDIKKIDTYVYAAAPKNVDLIDSID